MGTMHTKQAIICSLLVINSLSVYSHYERLSFNHITEKDGIPFKNNYYAIIQDSKGFMWFGSEEGLHRYDGYKFTNYYYDPDNIKSLCGQTVWGLQEDDQKKIWIAANRGTDVYEWKTDSFHHIPFAVGDDTTKSVYNINSTDVIQSRNMNIYVSTLNELYQYDKKRRILRPFSSMQGFPEMKNIEEITEIFEDSKEVIWLCTEDSGLYAVDVKRRKINHYRNDCLPPFKILQNEVLSITEDAYGDIWLATAQGLNRINATREKVTTYQYSPGNSSGLSHRFTSYVYNDNKNNLWVCTDVGGLNLYNRESDTFRHFMHDKDDENTILGNKTTIVFINNQDILWIPSIHFGMNYADLKSANMFHTYSNRPSDRNTLAYNVVSAIAEDEKGNLWIGTDGGGLDFYNRSTKKFTHYVHSPDDKRSLPSNSVLELYFDSDKQLWVGTFRGGLSKFIKANNSFINYLPDESNPYGIRGISVNTIVEDQHGNLLIGGQNSGLNVFNRKNGSFDHIMNIPGDSNSIATNFINSILIDSKGRIWIGTFNGLSNWNQETNRFVNYYNNELDSNSLSSNWVNCLFEDKKQNLWIGTQAGLNQFDRETGVFTVFSKKDGFASNIITGIAEDPVGNLWISTTGGLVKFDPETRKVTNFNTWNGLPGNEFVNCSCLKSRHGELLYGSTNGLVRFFPENVKINTVVPPVYITEFFIHNKRVPIDMKGLPLDKPIIEKDTIILKYRQNFITFQYIALNYIHAEKNQFAYMLKGFDKEWHFVDNERKATYTNLNPGEYTFIVKGSNNDGVWNEKGTSVLIRVLPPWYGTWWFISLSVILFFAILMMVYYMRLSFYRRQRDMLTRLVKEKTKSLQETTNYLEESNEEIKIQKEVLLSQKETLEQTNAILIQQKQQIEDQNLELDNHRNKLEHLVEERTRELEMALKKAEESDQLKSSFILNLSHEIRTPLNAILGFTNLILEEQFEENEKKLYNQILNSSTTCLLKLINDVLDISRIDTGELTLENIPVNINELLERSLKELEEANANSQNKNIEFKLTFPVGYSNHEPLIILNDFSRLYQIVTNLTDNALKYCEKGMIEIGFELMDAGGKNLRIFIKDSGIGISEEHQKVIFESFRKIENDTSKLYRGVGLGLTIASRLAILMGGRLDVSSKVGEGSTFSLIIPFTESRGLHVHNDIKALAIEVPENWEKYKILIADDEMSNLFYLEQILKPTGVKIFTANNGYETLELFKREQPDIVLMDIKMPDIDGFHTMLQIRDIRKNAVVIAQTAYGLADDLNTSLKDSFSNFLTKPFSKAELMEAIRPFLV